MKRLINAFVFVFLSCTAGAQSPEALFKEANALYEAQKYQEAASRYKQLADTGQTSAAVYFNLGNSYFRLGQYPEAVLYYEKAGLLDPTDEKIQANLTIARAQTGDDIEAIEEFFLTRWRRAVTHWLAVDTWAYISVGAFLLFLGGLGLAFFGVYTRRKRMGFAFGVVFFILSLLAFANGRALKEEVTGGHEAIIFSPSVTLRSAPNPQATSLSVFHAGNKVRILDQRNGWLEVRLINGKVGWLKEGDIRRI